MLTMPAYDVMSGEFVDEDEDERARREALAAMERAGLAAGGREPEVRGSTRFPPGSVPTPDPVTASRGAEDIWGGAWGDVPAEAAEPVDMDLTRDPEVLALADRAVSPREAWGRALQDPRRQVARGPEQPVVTPPARRATAVPVSTDPQHEIPDQRTEAARERVRALLATRAVGDQNTPQRRDYTGEDVADAVATPFRALGRALQAAAGRTPTRGPGFADRARVRDAQLDAAEAQRTDRDRDAGMARDRLQLDRDRFEAGEARAADQLDLVRERDAQRFAESQARSEVAAQLAQRRIRSMESEEARTAAMDAPDSDVSRLGQLALRTAIAGYPSEARQRLVEQLGIDDLDAHIGGLSMREADQLRRDLPAMFRDLAHRRGGGTGRGGGGAGGARGGGGVPRGQWGTDSDPVVEAAQAQGLDPALARSMATDPRTRRQLQAQVSSAALSRDRQAAAAGQRQDRTDREHAIPGWDRAPDAPQLSPQERRSLRDMSSADAAFNRATRELERDLGEVTVAERAAAVMGLGGERTRRIQANLTLMRTQIGQINRLGVSLGARESLEHEVPDLTARTTVDSLLSNIRALRHAKHNYVLDTMRSNGYRPASRSEGQGGGQTVRVRAPDGRIFRMPADRVEAARSRGYEVVP